MHISFENHESVINSAFNIKKNTEITKFLLKSSDNSKKSILKIESLRVYHFLLNVLLFNGFKWINQKKLIKAYNPLIESTKSKLNKFTNKSSFSEDEKASISNDIKKIENIIKFFDNTKFAEKMKQLFQIDSWRDLENNYLTLPPYTPPLPESEPDPEATDPIPDPDSIPDSKDPADPTFDEVPPPLPPRDPAPTQQNDELEVPPPLPPRDPAPTQNDELNEIINSSKFQSLANMRKEDEEEEIQDEEEDEFNDIDLSLNGPEGEPANPVVQTDEESKINAEIKYAAVNNVLETCDLFAKKINDDNNNTTQTNVSTDDDRDEEEWETSINPDDIV